MGRGRRVSHALQGAIDLSTDPAARGPARGSGGPLADATSSPRVLPEQLRRELIEIVPPVDPRMAAAGDPQLVLDPALLEDLGQGLRAGQGEVLVADDDLQALDRAVGPVLRGEELLVLLLPRLGA